MGDETGIEWTDHTCNFWHGCAKISAGCANCYMFAGKTRWGQDPRVVVRSADSFRKPLAKTRDGAWKWADGDKVFICSWSDFFLEEADPWRSEAWDVLRQRPGLTKQILTKRADRIASNLPADWHDGYPNAWLGVSVENRKAVARVAHLVEVPASVRFLSVEPLLEDVAYDLVPYLSGIDWVIVGGESGPGSRPCHTLWVAAIVEVCRAAGVACFVKQLGLHPEGPHGALGLASRKGGDMAEWPAELRVREWPRPRPGMAA